MSPDARVAVYYAPREESMLAALASRWFARSDVREHTVSPRHYGFHATLKPPFALAAGATIDDVRSQAAAEAARIESFELPRLRVSQLGRFVALTLAEPCPEALQAVADSCVEGFDKFRRPATPEELEQRRRGAFLSMRQNELLERWAYPYVFDQWQFHMTLTSSIANASIRQELFATLEDWFAPALEGARFDSLCLFTQPSRSDPFSLLERHTCSTR